MAISLHFVLNEIEYFTNLKPSQRKKEAYKKLFSKSLWSNQDR